MVAIPPGVFSAMVSTPTSGFTDFPSGFPTSLPAQFTSLPEISSDPGSSTASITNTISTPATSTTLSTLTITSSTSLITSISTGFSNSTSSTTSLPSSVSATPSSVPALLTSTSSAPSCNRTCTIATTTTLSLLALFILVLGAYMYHSRRQRHHLIHHTVWPRPVSPDPDFDILSQKKASISAPLPPMSSAPVLEVIPATPASPIRLSERFSAVLGKAFNSAPRIGGSSFVSSEGVYSISGGRRLSSVFGVGSRAGSQKAVQGRPMGIPQGYHSVADWEEGSENGSGQRMMGYSVSISSAGNSAANSREPSPSGRKSDDGRPSRGMAWLR